MAQFTAQGRVKLLINGDGVSFGLEPKDPFHFKVRSVQPHKRRLKLSGSSSTRIYSSSSSLNKPPNSSAEGHLNGGDESVHHENEMADHYFDEDDDDEYARDDLACFRGLVLDISYRSILYLTL